jgi:hypothetical protein
MEDRETTRIMMATVRHVTSSSGQKISGRLIFVEQIVHISVSNKSAAVGISIVEFITVVTRVRHWSLLCVK